MLKVGITGGIGSGKTTVCKIFEVLGVPIYYADDRAKEIVNTDRNVISEVKGLFGDDIYLTDGKLNRKRVADIVFNFPELLEQYNAIIHPVVIEDAKKWMRKNQQHDYVIKEAALLFEANTYKDLDYIICVTASIPVRMQRIKLRDKISEEQILARIKNQMPEEEKIRRCDFVIYNNGDAPLIPQVMKINEKLIQLTGKEYQV
jgi:dephospho-CoA kinase